MTVVAVLNEGEAILPARSGGPGEGACVFYLPLYRVTVDFE